MNLVEQSYLDLDQDAEELLFLVSDLGNKLALFTKQASKQKKHLGSFQYLKQRADDLDRQISQFKLKLSKFKINLLARREISVLILEKSKLYEWLRILNSETAALITATYWQSPSYDYSVSSQAGILTGKIHGTINDYSRDQSIAGNEYQKNFSKEFVGKWRGLPIPVFLTNSGMGALTTIISFLLRENKVTSPVFMGKNSYFQNKELIVKLLPNKIIEFNEEDLNEFKHIHQQELPAVIFIDTLSNSANLTLPDLKQIIRFLATRTKKETYLVIDNTCACLNFEPLKALNPTRGKLKLLVWESLNKYYQYGMDRTIGGFVWGLSQDAGGLYYARMHTGTIMSDISQAMLPTPNYKQLKQRLERINRNAGLLANSLSDKCLYGGMGGSLVLKINKREMTKILEKAKREQIPLIAGTSFGMNTTRIYLTATHTQYGEPFVRLSFGTETVWEMEKLKQILIC